jgi:hypothetical protein
MYVTLNGDGQWSPLPCLFDQTTSLTEALADYYNDASEGDLIKARNRFATFTENKRWEGNLTALRPGEGYFFRRMAPGAKKISFYRQSNSSKSAPTAKRSNSPQDGLTGEAGLFSNPNAATNMTMIAKVMAMGEGLKAYIDGELVGVGTAVDSLYFITLQSDKSGIVEFRTANGEKLVPEIGTISYLPDAHYGSLKRPIVLKKNNSTVYKVLENDHVIIIRNNERYDVTGKKLQ